ncbi:FHA domain-containing protein [Cyanobacteria bacterium FACHB-63]|nr:FHA domain-containing protein [Cyanobacteria bacterium FACHB-63]
MLMLKSVNFEQGEFQVHQLRSHPDQTEWVIGRSMTCDLVLASPEISRVHGRIIYRNSAYYFIDTGSASGSMLNGEIVPAEEPRQLQSGDLLQLGGTFLHIEALTPVDAVTGTIAPSIPTWQAEDLVCRCRRIVNETPDVKTFHFVAEPAVQFCYKPGQFVNLEVIINGKSVIRPYSISSSPTRPYHLSLTVKRVPSPPDQSEYPPGLVSNWLHDQLKVGDCVKLIGGAIGRFTCVPDVPAKLLLVSAGSGVTPMMSMLRWIQDTLIDCDVVFLHSATSPDQIIFRRELEAIAAQMPNLRLAVTITRAQPAWMGLTGRVSEAMLALVVPDLLERSVFVCGSTGFMQSIRSALENLKFPMQNYQEESFGDHSLIQSQQQAASELPTIRLDQNTLQPDEAPTVYFTESKQQAVVDNITPILEIAEQEGIQIRRSCRAGACGICKVKVRKGQVRYQSSPTALAIADQQKGFVLSCIAYPVGSLEVEA